MDDFERYLSGTDDLGLWGTDNALWLDDGGDACAHLFGLDVASAPAGTSLASEASTCTRETTTSMSVRVPHAARRPFQTQCVSVPEYAALESLESPGRPAGGTLPRSPLGPAQWGGLSEGLASAPMALQQQQQQEQQQQQQFTGGGVGAVLGRAAAAMSMPMAVGGGTSAPQPQQPRFGGVPARSAGAKPMPMPMPAGGMGMRSGLTAAVAAGFHADVQASHTASPIEPALGSVDLWPGSAPCHLRGGAGDGGQWPGDGFGAAPQSGLPADSVQTGFAPLDSLAALAPGSAATGAARLPATECAGSGVAGALAAGLAAAERAGGGFPKLDVLQQQHQQHQHQHQHQHQQHAQHQHQQHAAAAAAGSVRRPALGAGLLSAQLGRAAPQQLLSVPQPDDTAALRIAAAERAAADLPVPVGSAPAASAVPIPIPPVGASGRRRRGMPRSDSCTSLPTTLPSTSLDGGRRLRGGPAAMGSASQSQQDVEGALRRTTRGRTRRSSTADSSSLKRTSGLAAAWGIDADALEDLTRRTKALGSLTPEERAARILRYKDKRTRRNFDRRITYRCRKNLADTRPRVGGRFARDTDERAVPPNLTQKALKMQARQTRGKEEELGSSPGDAAHANASGLARPDSLQHIVAGLEATTIALQPTAAT